MKQINVISPVYKNQAINFNGFIVNFDINGKGILKFDEKETESVEKVFKIHPNIYKGDKLPIKENVETSFAKEEEGAVVNVELEHLKESNKALALENASLKKENEILKDKICTLEKKEKAWIQGVEKSAEDNKEEKPADETETKEGEGDKDKNMIKEDLNKKTVAQLKDLLNSDDFLPFKEEWKNLTKKDDIIDFILKKIEE